MVTMRDIEVDTKSLPKEGITWEILADAADGGYTGKRCGYMTPNILHKYHGTLASVQATDPGNGLPELTYVGVDSHAGIHQFLAVLNELMDKTTDTI